MYVVVSGSLGSLVVVVVNVEGVVGRVDGSGAGPGAGGSVIVVVVGRVDMVDGSVSMVVVHWQVQVQPCRWWRRRHMSRWW